ncbi:MAG: hypothetical protein WC521_08270 [Bdellovibrionales bacterium]
MRIFALAVFCALILAMPTRQANAASLVGDTCTELGITKVDNDKVTLVACLQCGTNPNCAAATALVWKAMMVHKALRPMVNEVTPTAVTCSSGRIKEILSNGSVTCVY